MSTSDEGVRYHTETLWNIRLGIRYHMRRQAFFDVWHRLTGVFTLIFSSSAVVALVGEHATPGQWFAAAAAVLQALDLMFETQKNARLHNDLRRQYLAIEPELLDKVTLTAEEYSKIQRSIKHIEIEEPPVKAWLLRVCHNDVARVSGYSETDPDERDLFKPINPLARMLKHFH